MPNFGLENGGNLFILLCAIKNATKYPQHVYRTQFDLSGYVDMQQFFVWYAENSRRILEDYFRLCIHFSAL